MGFADRVRDRLARRETTAPNDPEPQSPAAAIPAAWRTAAPTPSVIPKSSTAADTRGLHRDLTVRRQQLTLQTLGHDVLPSGGGRADGLIAVPHPIDPPRTGIVSRSVGGVRSGTRDIAEAAPETVEPPAQADAALPIVRAGAPTGGEGRGLPPATTVRRPTVDRSSSPRRDQPTTSRPTPPLLADTSRVGTPVPATIADPHPDGPVERVERAIEPIATDGKTPAVRSAPDTPDTTAPAAMSTTDGPAPSLSESEPVEPPPAIETPRSVAAASPTPGITVHRRAEPPVEPPPTNSGPRSVPTTPPTPDVTVRRRAEPPVDAAPTVGLRPPLPAPRTETTATAVSRRGAAADGPSAPRSTAAPSEPVVPRTSTARPLPSPTPTQSSPVGPRATPPTPPISPRSPTSPMPLVDRAASMTTPPIDREPAPTVDEPTLVASSTPARSTGAPDVGHESPDEDPSLPHPSVAAMPPTAGPGPEPAAAVGDPVLRPTGIDAPAPVAGPTPLRVLRAAASNPAVSRQETSGAAAPPRLDNATTQPEPRPRGLGLPLSDDATVALPLNRSMDRGHAPSTEPRATRRIDRAPTPTSRPDARSTWPPSPTPESTSTVVDRSHQDGLETLMQRVAAPTLDPSPPPSAPAPDVATIHVDRAAAQPEASTTESPLDTDALTDALYERIERRLRNDLLHEVERRGQLSRWG